MRCPQLGLFLCATLLACSGRYVSNGSDGAGAAPSGSASAGGSGALGGTPTTQPGVTAGSTAVGGATSTPGDPGPGGSAPEDLIDTGCGVPPGQPTATRVLITNTMMWWYRLSSLIWGPQGHAAPELPAALNYLQAGDLADAAIDQAIGETQGIPGAEIFVRDWLQLADDKILAADWNRALSRGPAVEALLSLRFDRTRVGAFTEPAFLITQSTISRRGTVMVGALFEQVVPPEPPGVQPFVPPPGLTRREGLAEAVSSPVCVACHTFIDPLGWSLENYDAAGNYVTLDAGKPVDASGTYRLPQSEAELQFKDIADLGEQLTGTCAVNLALADQFLNFALDRSQLAAPPLGTVLEVESARMRQAFIRSGGTYRSLLKAFAQSQAIQAD